MFGIKKYYGLRGDMLSYAISFIAGLDFLYVWDERTLEIGTLLTVWT